MVLTIFDEGADLKLMSIYHKAYISLIVKSVPGKKAVLSNEEKVSCPRKQQEPLIGFELTTNQLQVRHVTHCVTLMFEIHLNRVLLLLYLT